MPNQLPNDQELLQTLISTPSMSSVNSDFDVGNKQVSEILANWFEDLGFEVEVMPVAGHAPKRNVIATLGHGPHGLVLSGHSDTVPFDQHLWHFDPFGTSADDERIYGLGSCDMKGFFVAIMSALGRLDTKKLKRPLTLLATADEESGMAGAKKLLSEGRPQGRYCIIGEPTSNRPVRMHKGILMESIRLTGSSGHSSNPKLGNSALEGMHHVIDALFQYRTQLQQQFRHNAFEVPHPTLNLGSIKGGDNPNRICGDCELHLDARLIPGQHVQEVRDQIRELARAKAEAANLEIEFTPLFDGINPMETAPDSGIIKCCEKLASCHARSVDFATEGPFFTQLGMETVIMGPGDIALAHQPNEFLDFAELKTCSEQLTQLIDQICVSPSEI